MTIILPLGTGILTWTGHTVKLWLLIFSGTGAEIAVAYRRWRQKENQR